MTAPRGAVTGPNGHRVYPWQGRLYPSVTTIIRAGARGMAPFWLGSQGRCRVRHRQPGSAGTLAPRFLMAEQTVYSRRYGYAGTLDAIAELPQGGTVALLEVKTGKRVYPETALQLAGYAHADFIGATDGSAHPLPAIHEAAVLHLKPYTYRLVPMPVGQPNFDVFLAALAIYRWTHELAPQLLSDASETGRPATERG